MHFDVFKPLKEGAHSKSIAGTRWALIWRMADCKKDVKARLVATGLQDLDLRDRSVGTSGCASFRSSRLQVISLEALKNGTFGSWTSDMLFCTLAALGGKYSFALRRNGIPRSLTAFRNCMRRRADFNGAPATSHRSLRTALLNSAESLPGVA